MPKVSVIMAVYNAEKYLRCAIVSILNQTFSDFEFIIVNDGSYDFTPNIIRQYDDIRIKCIHQKNMGCAKAREIAIEHAKGEFLAIMDADDISFPDRLSKTVSYLDSHPNTVLVGTGYIVRNEEKNTDKIVIPQTDDVVLRRTLPYHDPFKDPTLLIRKNIFKLAGGYGVNHGFDYELYSRLAKFGKLANIEDILLITRQHDQQFFRMGYSPEEHRKRRLKIRWLTLWRLRPPFLLFVKTLIWLSFEFFVHLFPEGLRHQLPSELRDFFKKNIPPVI